VQLGYSPRVQIVHTSQSETGQIFVPEVNRALGLGCILVVLMFRSSSSLAAAYGIAVTGTMTITTILFYVLARTHWQWSIWRAGLLTAFFLIIDLAFFSANMLKIVQGGWVPLVIALGIFTLMTTWQRGRIIVRSPPGRRIDPARGAPQGSRRRESPISASSPCAFRERRCF